MGRCPAACRRVRRQHRRTARSGHRWIPAGYSPPSAGPAARQRPRIDPYFLNPSLDALIPVISLPPELAALSRGVEADPDNPIFNTYGENAWKSRTRAHPDVAELHHGITPKGVASAY